MRRPTPPDASSVRPRRLRRCAGMGAAAILALCTATRASAQAPAEGAAPPAGAPPPATPPAPVNVTPPVVLTHVDAVYPPSSLKERKHADVVLVVTVDVDGHVSKIDVAESGGPDLDEAALVAVRQCAFAPAMRDGTPLARRD